VLNESAVRLLFDMGGRTSKSRSNTTAISIAVIVLNTMDIGGWRGCNIELGCDPGSRSDRPADIIRRCEAPLVECDTAVRLGLECDCSVTLEANAPRGAEALGGDEFDAAEHHGVVAPGA